MESQRYKESGHILSDTSSSPVSSQAPSTYDTLMRQSSKLGKTATQTLDGAKRGARQIFGQKTKRVPVLDDEVEDLKKVVARSREILARAKTVLPFVFPDEIILDRTKISIIKRNFFWSSDVIAIRIEDTLNVSACVGPLFGSVTLASRVMSTVDHFNVGRFWRQDAIMVKQIIQGYLIARQNDLKTDHLTRDELIETLLELGRDGD